MKTWIPRNLQDDGMLPICEAPSYAKFVTQYVRLADHEQALTEQRQIIDEQVEENRGLRRDVLLLQTELTKHRQQIREYETRAWGYAKRTAVYWELRNRIEKTLDDRADIIMNGNGYKVFWPSEDRGYHAAYELRIVADILDDKNKVWDALVNQELRRA